MRHMPGVRGSPVTSDSGVDVLSSRILLRPADLNRSHRFYRDVLGLAVYREFGSPADPGVVFFLGPGLLEVSGHAAGSPGRSVMIWLQVRDVRAEHERLAAAGVHVLRGPQTEPWGLIEMWMRTRTASRSFSSRSRPITCSAAARGPFRSQRDESHAAEADIHPKCDDA